MTYQLSICDGRQHAPFVYFSNGKSGDDHFCVVVTHRILSPDETQRWASKIVYYTAARSRWAAAAHVPRVITAVSTSSSCVTASCGVMHWWRAWTWTPLDHLCFERDASLCTPSSMSAVSTTRGSGMLSTLPRPLTAPTAGVSFRRDLHSRPRAYCSEHFKNRTCATASRSAMV